MGEGQGLRLRMDGGDKEGPSRGTAPAGGGGAGGTGERAEVPGPWWDGPKAPRRCWPRGPLRLGPL